MGFMDKVKSQASAIAEKAQEGARAGQDKLSSMQAKRHADGLLLELGGLTYLARVGRGTPVDDARTEQLVAELSAHEAAHGPVTVSPAVPLPGDTGSYVPGVAPSGSPAPAGPLPTGPVSGMEPPSGAAPAPGSFQGAVPRAVTDALGDGPAEGQEGLSAPGTLPAG